MGRSDHSGVRSRSVLGSAVVVTTALLAAACGSQADEPELALPEGWTFQLQTDDEPAPAIDFGAIAEAAVGQQVDEPEPAPLPEPDPTPTPEPTPEPPPEPATDDELARRWWQWAADEPWDTSPLADPDGTHCHRNQPDDVWFLAPSVGGEADRVCTIPPGRELFVPVLVRWCDPAGECGFTDPQGAALLDGRELALLPVSNTTPYEVAGTADNPVTPSSDPMRVTDTGWWVRIADLSPGRHELVVYGTSLELEVAVRYLLDVEAS